MAVRFSKEDWLKAGLDQLAQHGPDGVKLANLCKALGRTSGAFYFHFNDHADFVAELLASWEKTHTDDIINASESYPEQLNILVMDLDHEIEIAMRLFGYQNRTVASKLEEVDEKRIAFLTNLHSQSNELTAETAQNLAELEYAAFVGTQLVWKNNRRTQSAKLGATFDQLVKIYLQRSKMK